MPTLQLVPEITEKLELFRTETLAGSDPIDKKKQAANVAMDELLESTVGLDNFVLTEIPINNTRAALYIYLNASVSPQFALFGKLTSDRVTARRPTIDR